MSDKIVKISVISIIAAVFLGIGIFAAFEFATLDLIENYTTPPEYYNYVTVQEPSCLVLGQLCDKETLREFRDTLASEEKEYDQALNAHALAKLKYIGPLAIILTVLGLIIHGVVKKYRQTLYFISIPFLLAALGLLIQSGVELGSYLFTTVDWGAYAIAGVVIVISFIVAWLAQRRLSKLED